MKKSLGWGWDFFLARMALMFWEVFAAFTSLFWGLPCRADKSSRLIGWRGLNWQATARVPNRNAMAARCLVSLWAANDIYFNSQRIGMLSATVAHCQWDGTLPLGNAGLVCLPTSLLGIISDLQVHRTHEAVFGSQSGSTLAIVCHYYPGHCGSDWRSEWLKHPFAESAVWWFHT